MATVIHTACQVCGKLYATTKKNFSRNRFHFCSPKCQGVYSSLHQREDLTGRAFGRWTVIAHADAPQLWLCRCECGREKAVHAGNLRQSKSTGCPRHEKAARHIYPARAKKIPEWGVWSGMKNRCLNPRNRSYRRYGGRGILVCERWLASFGDFLADMGPRPTAKHSIERDDVNGNYEPSNCHWATLDEQLKNTSRTIRISHEGVTDSASGWAKRTGLRPNTILSRYHAGVRGGALFLPARQPHGTYGQALPQN